jgi:hypothetical protein
MGGKAARTRELIVELYGIVGELERLYEGRRFTPDGHLVGSLGEVYAAAAYGLELCVASTPVYDAVAPDGRLVQIKATQINRVALSAEPDHLLVLAVRPDGTFEEIYNGPGVEPWRLAGPMQKTGQRSIGLATLRRLAAAVPPEQRIPPAVSGQKEV